MHFCAHNPKEKNLSMIMRKTKCNCTKQNRRFY